MKQLEKQRRFQGYDLHQVHASKHAYCYAKSYKGTLVSFEVFERRIEQPRTRIGGNYSAFTEPFERYPGEKAFGRWAWDEKTFEWAMQKVAEIEARFNKLETVSIAA